MNFIRVQSAERADCTVRAYAAATGLEYLQAHMVLAGLGRKRGQRFKFWSHQEALELEQQPEFARKRLASVLPELGQGRFMVRHARHVFAVVDGVILDHCRPKDSTLIEMVYEVRRVQ